MKNSLRFLFALSLLILARCISFAQCQAAYTHTVNAATVSVTDASTYSTSIGHLWTFGDGYYDNSGNPAPHTYQYATTYTVCLTISDSFPQTCNSTVCDTVQIVNAPHAPCNATFTANVDSVQPYVYFYNNSSYSVSWFWNFGDGNTSTLQSPSHSYSVNATYSVCLSTVTISGDTCSFCDTINSTPCAQKLNVAVTHTTNVTTVSFTGTCSGASIPNYDWQFGDGNNSSVQNPVHTYQYNGTYSACLTYWDSSGGCGKTDCNTIVITGGSNPPCSLNFNYGIDSLQPNTIYFNAYCSYPVSQWLWNFGDGNTGTGQWPVHTYITGNGTYSVCLSAIRASYNDTCTFCSMVKIGACNYLQGAAFSDANANCIKDPGDNPLGNWTVQAQETSSQIIYSGSTNSNGDYSIAVSPGNYTISLVPKNYWSQNCPVSPSYYSASVNVLNFVNGLNFGMQPTVSCADLGVNIATTSQRRCLKNKYAVQCANYGTINVAGAVLTIDFDNPLGRIIPLSSTLPWSSFSGTLYTWNLGTMAAGQLVSFTVTDSVSCNSTLGDTLTVHAQTTPYAGDCDLTNNNSEDVHTIIGSSDPNEKLATTTTNKVAITTATILKTDTVFYTIGFQNTGNDTAWNIVVYDTIDTHLNAASIISGISSHPYIFQSFGNGVAAWTFSNINLPDSTTNELASHGFIKFQILQKPNNPGGTKIKNHAAIVFDFNAPVLTDTVVLTVGPLTSVYAMEAKENIEIYPNPAEGKFTVQSLNLNIERIEIYNVFGEKVYSLTVNRKQETVNLSVASGIYFLKVATEQGISTKKIIISASE
ncbi:MAG: PKD domain-containing protein [Bacteroidetes bacterium]|nr:PKD domain-containing protein [Bacteroidota bacterium]